MNIYIYIYLQSANLWYMWMIMGLVAKVHINTKMIWMYVYYGTICFTSVSIVENVAYTNYLFHCISCRLCYQINHCNVNFINYAQNINGANYFAYMLYIHIWCIKCYMMCSLRNVFLNHFNGNYSFRFPMPCAIYLNNEALRFSVSQGIQKSLFIIDTQR